MKLIAGLNLRTAVTTITPKAEAITAAARSTARVVGGRDAYVVTGVPKVEIAAISAGIGQLASLTEKGTAYRFPSNFLGRYQALLDKAGIPSKGADQANRFLNTVLLREDKPTTAAYVRTVMETPKALDETLTNIARYTDNPNNTILTPEIADVSAAFDRVAFLPFLGSETLSNGLVNAMKKDLELSGQRLTAAAELGIGPDVTVIGQGPTGAVLARGLSTEFAALRENEGLELTAAVIGGETTFSAGSQWNLNSPTRPVRGEKLGPGGPLNPIDDRVADADFIGGYYGKARVIDDMSKISLHSSGLPVLTAQLDVVSRQAGGGYLLKTSQGKVPTKIVTFGAGLGDSAKPFSTETGTAFVNAQYALAREAIAAAKAGDSAPLREYPLWSSTLDFFRAQAELNDPLTMFATGATARELRLATREARVDNFEVKLGTKGEVLYKNARGEFAAVVNADFKRRSLEAIRVAPDYNARALYLARKPLYEIAPSQPAQKVVGVVGFGDSARTALEAITGFGPDTRSPKQLGIAPKLVWFVGEKGPRDCAEFYLGDLFRGFKSFSSELERMGSPGLSELIRTKLKKLEGKSDEKVIGGYLREFSNLLTTQKPKAYFDDLLKNTKLTDDQKRRAFGVFLQERDAVRPRYNQLVIPIEKGQIELIRARVIDTSEVPAAEGQPARVLLKTADQEVLVDHALDARGNVNEIGKALRELTGSDKDPFSDVTKYDLVEVVDPSGARRVVGKRLKGEDVFSVGPAAAVVENNTTNVGANVVSIFLNRPLNELSAGAIAQEVATQFKKGQLGTREARAAGEVKLAKQLSRLEGAREIKVGTTRGESRNFNLAANDRFLRSALERNPLGHQSSLNALLDRVKLTRGDRLSIQFSRRGTNGVTVTAPAALLDEVVAWAKTREASDYLRSALDTGRPVSIERAVDPATGSLVPIQNWL